MAALEIRDLHKHYDGFRALDGANLTVPEGSLYGLLGPNGAGKTTLMKSVAGLRRPNSGRIHLFGRPLERRLLTQVGALLESPGLWAHLDAVAHLRIHARLRGVPQRRIDEVLELVKLTEVRSRKVAKYSLGMRWRLGIAIALLGRPRLVVLDASACWWPGGPRTRARCTASPSTATSKRASSACSRRRVPRCADQTPGHRRYASRRAGVTPPGEASPHGSDERRGWPASAPPERPAEPAGSAPGSPIPQSRPGPAALRHPKHRAAMPPLTPSPSAAGGAPRPARRHRPGAGWRRPARCPCTPRAPPA